MTVKFDTGIPTTFWKGAAPEGTLQATSPHSPIIYGTRDQFNVVPFLVAAQTPGSVWLVDAIQATNHSAANAYWTASVFTNLAADRPLLSNPNMAYFNFAWGLLLYPGESVVMDVNHTLSRESSLLFTVNGAGAANGATSIPIAATFNYLSAGRVVNFTKINTTTVVPATLTAPYNPGATSLTVGAISNSLAAGSIGNAYIEPGLWAASWPGTNANSTANPLANDGVPGAITIAFTGRVL